MAVSQRPIAPGPLIPLVVVGAGNQPVAGGHPLVQSHVLHVAGVDGLADGLDENDGIDALPPQVGGVQVHADGGPDFPAKAQEGLGVVNAIPGVGLDAQFDPVVVGDGGGLFPVGDDSLLPLPAVGILPHDEGGVDDPVGCLVLGTAGGSAGQQTDVVNVQAAGQLAGGHQVGVGALGNGRVGMDRVSMAAEGTDLHLPLIQAALEGLERGRGCFQLDRVVVDLGDVPAGAGLDQSDAVLLAGVEHLLPGSLQHACRHQCDFHVCPVLPWVSSNPLGNDVLFPETKKKSYPRRATKALRFTATGYQGHERMIDFRLFHSRLIRPAGRGRHSFQTRPESLSPKRSARCLRYSPVCGGAAKNAG